MEDDEPLLVQRIRDALRRLRMVVPIVRVSVAPRPKWIEVPDKGMVHTRLICWNILDAGTEMTQPEFEFLHPSITQQQLESELPDFFPGVSVFVDDDISTGDD